jgi:hypothetical protein
MVNTEYRFRDMVYALFKLPLMSDKEKADLRSRASLLDDTWTITEQLASERYQSLKKSEAERAKQIERDKYFRRV